MIFFFYSNTFLKYFTFDSTKSILNPFCRYFAYSDFIHKTYCVTSRKSYEYDVYIKLLEILQWAPPWPAASIKCCLHFKARHKNWFTVCCIETYTALKGVIMGEFRYFLLIALLQIYLYQFSTYWCIFHWSVTTFNDLNTIQNSFFNAELPPLHQKTCLYLNKSAIPRSGFSLKTQAKKKLFRQWSWIVRQRNNSVLMLNNCSLLFADLSADGCIVRGLLRCVFWLKHCDPTEYKSFAEKSEVMSDLSFIIRIS